MSIRPEKEKALLKWMKNLNIHESDLVEKFILGGGKGGQKINKTASCVYLKHIPTQIEVKCQKSRSRTLNRYLARYTLCEQIAFLIHREETAKQRLIAKMRRQKKRRSRRAQEKRLQDKKKRSSIKSMRVSPKKEENT